MTSFKIINSLLVSPPHFLTFASKLTLKISTLHLVSFDAMTESTMHMLLMQNPKVKKFSSPLKGEKDYSACSLKSFQTFHSSCDTGLRKLNELQELITSFRDHE